MFRQNIARPPGTQRCLEPQAAFAQLSAGTLSELCRWVTVERAFPHGSDIGSANDPTGATRIDAAVLLALLRTGAGGDDVAVALIRRPPHMRENPGEIAFPGGRLEPGETPCDAALREAHEEVALPPSSVQVLGALPPVSRASRPGPIAAFVGAVAGGTPLRASPGEVDAVLVTPLVVVSDLTRYWEETWHRPDGQLRQMPFFDLGDDVIWGASARILVSLLDRLAAAL
ncbi:MAG: NUDIX hydrolase [Acidimicrobiales bacterium]